MDSSGERLAAWYSYAATEEGFVGSLLQLLRERTGITLEQQQQKYGAGDAEFIRLQGMPLPRPDRFRSDAQRIAAACSLAFPLAFVHDLVLARNLTLLAGGEQAYRAAFDAGESLDEPPEE